MHVGTNSGVRGRCSFLSDICALGLLVRAFMYGAGSVAAAVLAAGTGWCRLLLCPLVSRRVLLVSSRA